MPYECECVCVCVRASLSISMCLFDAVFACLLLARPLHSVTTMAQLAHLMRARCAAQYTRIAASVVDAIAAHAHASLHWTTRFHCSRVLQPAVAHSFASPCAVQLAPTPPPSRVLCPSSCPRVSAIHKLRSVKSVRRIGRTPSPESCERRGGSTCRDQVARLS